MNRETSGALGAAEAASCTTILSMSEVGQKQTWKERPLLAQSGHSAERRGQQSAITGNRPFSLDHLVGG